MRSKIGRKSLKTAVLEGLCMYQKNPIKIERGCDKTIVGGNVRKKV